VATVPTPLPRIETLRIEEAVTKDALDQILIYLQRTRSVLFDSSTEDALGASLAALSGRAKDIYTFALGTPVVSADPPLTALEAVADSSMQEARVRFETAPGDQVTIDITVDGETRGTLSVPGGTQVVSITSFTNAGLTKDAVIRPVVTAVSGDSGLDAVVQVRAG
jgi:hypothetical protein